MVHVLQCPGLRSQMDTYHNTVSHYIYQCSYIRLCHLKAWPADDYLYSYMCKHLLNAESQM